MPTDILQFDGGTAFITRSDDDRCEKGGEHVWNSSVLTYRTRRGEERYISGKHYFIKQEGNDGRPRKEHRRMRICMGQVACSKCGMPYTLAHNPYFL